MISYRAITVSLAMIFFAATTSLHSQSAGEANTAAVDSLQQVNAMKDSIFSNINQEYQAIKPILQKSCFDCHSQFTEYPWYHKLPIIGGMLDDHVKEGLEHLNLTNDFPFTGKESLPELLEDMKEEIAEGEMPLWSYRLMHWGTLIEGAQRDSVLGWIDDASAAVGPLFDYVPEPEETDSDDDD